MEAARAYAIVCVFNIAEVYVSVFACDSGQR